MTDIWDERPIAFYTAPPGNEGVYHTEKMDAWLEKLQEEYDEFAGDSFVYFSLLNDIKKAMIEWTTRTYEREGKTIIKGYDPVIDTIKKILDNSEFTTDSELASDTEEG